MVLVLWCKVLYARSGKGAHSVPRTVVELYHGGWAGGTAAYLATLLTHVDSKRYRPLYIGYAGDPGLARLASLGVAVRAVKTWGELLRVVRAEGEGLVHTHGVRANLEGRSLAAMSRVPHVVTVHSRLDQDYRSAWRRRIARLVDDRSLARALALIAVSKAIRDDLIRRGVPKGRIHVVESAVPPPATPWTRADVGRAFGVPDNTLLVATAARHHPVKGLDVLLAAVARLVREEHLPPFRVLLFGEGPDTELLRAQAKQAGVAEQVAFVGFRADVRDILAGVDLFVLPSRAEGFGLAALEAMAAGVPVVTTSVGNLPHLLDHGRAGILVPSEDAGALATALGDLLRNPERRLALGAAARARYLEAFTPERMAEETMAVWDAVWQATDGSVGVR